jgi:hypothetical protein
VSHKLNENANLRHATLSLPPIGEILAELVYRPRADPPRMRWEGQAASSEEIHAARSIRGFLARARAVYLSQVSQRKTST